MIEAKGDLWEIGKTASAIVITTNGSLRKNGDSVMGGGCAREAAERYPLLAADLGRAVLKRGNHCHVFRYSSMQEIVAMPTKNSVSRSSPLPLVVRSVAELNELAYWHDWTRVVLPRPGCGLGGLLWRNVKPIVDELDDRFTVVTYA